jgi:mRNA-degrading endonuclease YafQ of YafQ-DinJ toxin-antitoxin module
MKPKNNGKPAISAQPQRVCRIMASELFFKTLENFKHNSRVLQALKEFIQTKRANPNQKFGSKDYPFVGAGPLKGIPHAGLDFDVSIVYTIEGKNPNIITLYGLFTHDQLGTGTPANIKRQKQARASFDHQVSVKPLEPVDA